MLMIPLRVTPSRDERKLGATELLQGVGDYEFNKFETTTSNALLDGYVPSWMTNFTEINVDFINLSKVKKHVITLRTLRDYLTIGNDDDNLRIPMTPITAQKIADAWECILPTTQLVNLAWRNAFYRLTPEPWGPPYEHTTMASLSRIKAFNVKINKQLLDKQCEKNFLTAGHMKDIVITNALRSRPEQVAIYGWHQQNGTPIQNLYLGHANTYYDYSHGVRLWSRECLLDGQKDDLVRLLQDVSLSRAFSNEGVMIVTRQPN